MIKLAVFFTLFVELTLASPLGIYEKQLQKDGFDLKVLHEVNDFLINTIKCNFFQEIEKGSREVLEEFAGEKMQAEASCTYLVDMNVCSYYFA